MRVDRAHIEVIAEAPADAFRPRPAAEVAAAREDARRAGGLPAVGRRPPPPRPAPARHALVEAPRELPLVLVGAAGQWAHELRRRDRHRRGRRRRAGGALHGRPRARCCPPRRRASGCPRSRRSRAGRRSSPPTGRRCARCSTAARRSSSRRTSRAWWPPRTPHAAPPRRRPMDLGGRRDGDVGRLRDGAGRLGPGAGAAEVRAHEPVGRRDARPAPPGRARARRRGSALRGTRGRCGRSRS